MSPLSPTPTIDSTAATTGGPDDVTTTQRVYPAILSSRSLRSASMKLLSWVARQQTGTVDVSSTRPTRIALLVKSFALLDRVVDVEPDWDSYGGAPPTPAAVRAASRVLTIVHSLFNETAGERVVPFHVAPIPTGGIQIEWRGPRATLELDIGPDGAFGYLLIQGRGETRRFEESENISWATVLELVGRVVISDFKDMDLGSERT